MAAYLQLADLHRVRNVISYTYNIGRNIHYVHDHKTVITYVDQSID